MIWLIVLYLITVPLFMIYGAELRPVQEGCYQALSLIIITAGLFFDNKPVKRTDLNVWIGLSGIWIMFIWLIHQLGFSIMFNYFLGLGVYFTVIRTVKKEQFKILAKTLTWLGLFALIYLVAQYYGFDIRGQKVINVPGAVPHCSFFGLKAAMGTYFAIITPMVISLSPVGILFLLPVACSISSTAVLAVTVAILFFYWFRKRIIFWILIPIILACGAFYSLKVEQWDMMGSRPPMWGIVLQDCFKAPLGRGLDTFRNDNRLGATRYFKHSYNNHKTVRSTLTTQGWAMEKEDIDHINKIKKWKEETGRESISTLDFWDAAHNEYLQITFELGFPAIAIIGFIFYGIFMRFKRSKRDNATVALTACLIAFFISCMGHFPLHLARIGHILPVLMGLFYLTTEDDV